MSEFNTTPSQADMLIEQSKKRIKDITELMKPPADMMNSFMLKRSEEQTFQREMEKNHNS